MSDDWRKKATPASYASGDLARRCLLPDRKPADQVREDAVEARGQRHVFRLEGLPPSANKLVQPAQMGKGRMRLVKSQEAEAWIDKTRLALNMLRPQLHPLDGPLVLTLVFDVARISCDTSNRIKALEDVLTGEAWHDDLQVVQLHASKRISDNGLESVLVDVRACTEGECTATTRARIASSTKGRDQR